MLERMKRLVTEHKTALLAILCLLIVGVAYAVGRHSAPEQTAAEKPAVMTQEQCGRTSKASHGGTSGAACTVDHLLCECSDRRACGAGSRAADQGGQSVTATGGAGEV